MRNYFEDAKDMIEYNYYNPNSRMNGFFNEIGKLVIFALIIVIAIFAVRHFTKEESASDKYETAIALSEFDHKVSAIEIKHELEAIGELATSKYTYLGQAFIKDYRTVFGWNVPLTSHTIDITYSGVIKVGYDVDEIEVEVKDSTIYVELPAPRVLDNYIDDYYTDEDNNIFNPIETDEVTSKLKEVKAAELEKCRDEAYNKAEKEVKKLILGILQVFDDYNVKFV